MKLSKLFLSSLVLFCSLNSQAINFEELIWITQDKKLQDTLKGHRVLKNFKEYLDCRAIHCYQYIICTARHDYGTRITEYFITKISGGSIFFRDELFFTSEKFDKLPDICKENTL